MQGESGYVTTPAGNVLVLSERDYAFDTGELTIRPTSAPSGSTFATTSHRRMVPCVDGTRTPAGSGCRRFTGAPVRTALSANTDRFGLAYWWYEPFRIGGLLPFTRAECFGTISAGDNESPG